MTDNLEKVIAVGKAKLSDAQKIERLRATLQSMTGYLLNAKIDLETGAPKRTAIMTIEGGLKIARQTLIDTQ